MTDGGGEAVETLRMPEESVTCPSCKVTAQQQQGPRLRQMCPFCGHLYGGGQGAGPTPTRDVRVRGTRSNSRYPAVEGVRFPVIVSTSVIDLGN